MDLAHLIQEYGYLAVAIGSFFEGEAVLLGGSFAASQGHLALALVLPLAALFSFLGDLPYFFAGRRYGEAAIARFPSVQSRRGRIEKMLHRHHVLLVLSLRFLYGLRMAGLVTLGMSRLSVMRFLVLDAIGALIWSAAVCAAGFGAGRLVERLQAQVGDGSRITLFVAAMLCASLLAFMVRRKGTVNTNR